MRPGKKRPTRMRNGVLEIFCTGCEEFYPATTTYFSYYAKGQLSLMSRCRPCILVYSRQYQARRKVKKSNQVPPAVRKILTRSESAQLWRNSALTVPPWAQRGHDANH